MQSVLFDRDVLRAGERTLNGSSMDSLWHFIQKQLEQNQFFSGGLILMAAGALAAYFRDAPGQLWAWLRSQLVLEIDILDRESAFDWIEQWLAAHEYARHRARCLTVKTRGVEYDERQADPSADSRPRILFCPAPGRHVLFYRGRLVILHRERPDLNQATQQPVNVRESFSITIFSRDRRLAQQLLEDARDLALPRAGQRLSIHRPDYGSWSELKQRSLRSPDSVVLRGGHMEELIADARRFLASRQWYLDRGIPYRRGYLLHGPPGTGKSSAVIAVASALQMDIAILSLASTSLDDSQLADLLAELPVNAVALIEDIDCAFSGRGQEPDKASKLSFSGLLNAIDGVAAGEGRLLFATTNHLERLDPALIRPGRIDKKLEVLYADRDQLLRIFLRFFPHAATSLAETFAAALPEHRLAMSAVQNYLIRHAESAEEACENVEWLASEARGRPHAAQVETECSARPPLATPSISEWFSVGL
jgi:chaperone BCS1